MSQVVGHVQCGRVPLGRPPGQGLQADPLQFPGDGVVDLPGRAGIQRDDLLQQPNEFVICELNPIEILEFLAEVLL